MPGHRYLDASADAKPDADADCDDAHHFAHDRANSRDGEPRRDEQSAVRRRSAAGFHCKEPAIRPTTLANVRKYYAAFVKCLDKAWAPIVRKAGFTFTPPRLEVFTGRSRPSCGVTDSAAYCGGGVISMSADYDLKNYRTDDKLWARTTMAHLIAHEYGHHIQRLTGITAASAARSLTMSADAGLAESRRIELQASCFSGVYLGADRRYFPVSGSWLQRWVWTIRHRGDEWNLTRSHGKSSTHSRWTRRGFDAASPSACNTFTASAASIA